MIKTLAFILLQIGSFNEKILSTIQDFQNSDGIKNGIVSVNVVDLENGKDILSFNNNQSVNSASIMKLISTSTILINKGSDYKFKTSISYTGEIINNILQGDLIIRSEGDPSFGSTRYASTNNTINEIGEVLKNIGITKIEGKIRIIDPDFFKYDIPDNWVWGDLGNYYGALPHQFNYHENYFTVYFNAGYEVGSESNIESLSPFSKNWKIINQVKAGPKGSGDQVYIYSSPQSNELVMKGTVPAGCKSFGVKGSMPQPSYVFLEELSESLNQKGIINTFNGDQKESFFENYYHENILKVFYSPSLGDLIADCNFSSINLFADSFAQKTAADAMSTYSLNLGAKELEKQWKSKGVNLEGFDLKDGSGLSPSNLITSEGLSQILYEISKSSDYPTFLESIPVVGESGTVKYLDSRNITKGRVHAKSGSITGTRSYAGYANTLAGKKIAFVIVVNRYREDKKQEVRSFLEKFLIDIIDINQF